MILVSVSRDSNPAPYIDALRRVGADAEAVYAQSLPDGYAGVILAGGDDMEPAFYGRVDRGSRGIDTVRDHAELALLERCGQRKLPVLGICRGMQVINVWAGGTLRQNVRHHGTPETIDHVVTAEPPLSDLYGTRFVCNSAHHQAVGKTGADLRVCARCGRVIEAVEHSTLPIFGVQFHPERMTDGDKLFRWWTEKFIYGLQTAFFRI